MSQDRIEKIKTRMNWLLMELTHEGYLDGYTTKGFKEELSKLISELKELEDNLK